MSRRHTKPVDQVEVNDRQSRAKRHHYIPIFYSRRWVEETGRLCEFSRQAGEIKFHWKAPRGTGWAPSIYELQGFPPHLAQQVEEKFFGAVDGLAAEALDLLDSKGSAANLNTRLRSAWSRFIVTMLMRMPEDIEKFRARWASSMGQTDPAAEERYRRGRRPEDPPTMAEYIKAEPLWRREKSTFEALMFVLDNPSLGAKLNSMPWRVLEFDNASYELLASDRPIIRTHQLLLPDGHIAIPIGPRKLFITSPSEDWLKGFARANRSALAKEVNLQVTRQAVRFVYSRTVSSLTFVRRHMSTGIQPRLIEMLPEPPLRPATVIRAKPTPIRTFRLTPPPPSGP